MSATVRVRVVGQCLEPVMEADAHLIEAMGGGEVTARLSRARVPAHHRWYWAKLHRLVETSEVGEHYPTADHLHRALLIETGHTASVYVPSLGKIQVPDSTAFAAMDQETFRAYTDRAFALVAASFGINVENLE